MQCADIFYLKADITQLVMDQRKVNMLAREIGEKLGFWKPICVHHHMLMGLTQPEEEKVILQLTVELKEEIKIDDVTKIVVEKINPIRKSEPSPVKQLLTGSFEILMQDTPIINRTIEVRVTSNSNWETKTIEETETLPIGNLDVRFDRLSDDGFKCRMTVRRKLIGADAAIAKKMSKSNPDSAIFMTDSTDDINRKIKKAYCPEKSTVDNPIMEYCKYIIFEKFPVMEITRPEKFGGNLEIHSYDELVKIYEEGQLHPMDLKAASAFYINELLKPVRGHFENNNKAKSLFEQVQSFKITR
jgi:tyrosyl-tRNA synthetase